MFTTLSTLAMLLPHSAHAGDDPLLPDSTAPALLGAWSVGYGGYVGATTGYLIGEAMEENERAHSTQGIAPGAAVGATVGGVTTALIGKQLEADNDDVLFLASSSGLGVFYGVQAGRALIGIDEDGATERIHAAGLAGSMAGVGIGFLGNAPNSRAMLHYDVATGVGSLAAGGLSDAANLYNPENRQARAAINLGGSALFSTIALGHSALADESPNAAAWGLSLGHGAWIGAMSPYLFTDNPSQRQITGGLRAGTGLGYAGALALSAAGNPSPKSATLQGIGITAGNALGAGIPLSLGKEGPTRAVVGPALAGGVGGQILGAAIAPHYDLSGDDAFLLGTLGAWTSFQTAGWVTYATATSDTSARPLGYGLTAGGSGTLLAMGLAPVLDVPASGSMMMLSGGGWGTWYGSWAAQLGSGDSDSAWLATTAAGNGGLLGVAAAEAAGWNPTWKDVGYIDGMGLLGGAAGGLAGVIFLYEDDNWDPLIVSTLVGSTAGLAGGAVLAARNPHRGKTKAPQLDLGRGTWRPRFEARPWMSDDGDPGAWVQVSLDEVARK